MARHSSYGAASNCNIACSGNSSETCGGVWANSVFTTGASGVIGCYADESTRDLPYLVSSGASMTLEMCANDCRVAGYKYAGAQVGSQCFCGNSYGRYGSSTACTVACGGNGAETCGGPWSNTLLATGL